MISFYLQNNACNKKKDMFLSKKRKMDEQGKRFD